MSLTIIKASRIITMDPDHPVAEAVAVDDTTGRIVAVGTLAQCQGADSGATLTDLGNHVLLPGFIDAHNHPFLSGLMTQAPAKWIAPYVGYPTFADVEAEFKKSDEEAKPGQALLFNGLDRMLQGAPVLNLTSLDKYFPDRPAIVLDNSGHEVYFNSQIVKLLGWRDAKPPADPTGARYGRNEDGTSNGLAYETAAVADVLVPVLERVIENPLDSAARWYCLMASFGITASSDHAYATKLLTGYQALAGMPDCPLRVTFYHVATAPDCHEPLPSDVPSDFLSKAGIKLWADGSPWVGTIATSLPYLDTPTTRTAQIKPGATYDSMLNYTRGQFDDMLTKSAAEGLQVSVHVNGDVGIDLVLDGYERALSRMHLLGTDHRWRIEHLGSARGDQLHRAAALGVSMSLGQFQFIYWGDLLDGQIFDSAEGSKWIRAGDAVKSGGRFSFHNDGLVSPPNVLLNFQTAVTRRTPSGTLHGPDQAISLDDAIKAQTIHAAYMLGRDKDIGSISIGKLADFVQLSADPYDVDPGTLATSVKVEATWLAGRKVNPAGFLTQVAALDQSEHRGVAAHHAATAHRC